MNYKIIFRFLSIGLASLAFVFLISLSVGCWFDFEQELSTMPEWILSIAFTLILSCWFRYQSIGAGPKLFRREALAIIGLGWIVASFIGAIPYFLVLKHVSFVDVFFESVSGLTTTGATVFDDFSEFPRSLIFWRSMSQWIGGLGVIVFFVAILSSLGASAKFLYSNESTGTASDMDTGRIQSGVMRILILYCILSFACVLLYHLEGIPWFESICFMLTTISTGGFSPGDISVTVYQSPVFEWTMILFMVIGGTSFFYFLKFFGNRKSGIFENTEVNVYLASLFLSATFMLAILIYAGAEESAGNMLRGAAFQVVSIMTTSGFATENYALWPSAAKVLFLILMMSGGCTGSTSGGIKVLRVLIVTKVSQFRIERMFDPRIVRVLKIGDRHVDDTEQSNALAFGILAGGVIIVSLFIIALLEPEISFAGQFSLTLASVFNIGPGLAEVGPEASLGFLESGTKLFLTGLMLMGRLEFYAFLALFLPVFWKRF